MGEALRLAWRHLRWMGLGVLLGGGPGAGLIAQAQTVAAPSAPVMQVISFGDEGVPLAPLWAQAMSARDSAEVSTMVQFPVRSPGLMPGPLRNDARWTDAQWMVQPLFLIGNDAGSVAWLKANQTGLAQLRAHGLLVEVPDAATFKRLEGLADGLPLVPTSSAWLTRRLQAAGAAVLPLLILPDGRMTQQVPEGAP